MKNLLLLTAFLCVAFFAEAQFVTGQKLISGQFGFYFNNTDVASTPGTSNQIFSFSFSPSFSRFKSPTLIIGGGLYYAYNRYHNFIGNPQSELSQSSHTMGLFVNRTKLESLAKKFYFTYTGTASANYQTSHPFFPSGSSFTWQDYYGATVSGSIGLLYELSPRFLLSWELSNLVAVSYRYQVETGKLANGTTSYKNVSNNVSLLTNLSGFNLGNVGIGVRYMLKK